MPTQQMKQVVKARSNLVLDEPFFGSLAMRLKVEEDTSGRTETFCTDGYWLLFNPDFVDEKTPAETKTIIAHEIMHLALQHHTRRGTRDTKRWNYACDFVINDILKDAGFEMPDDACLNDKFKGMHAEEVYNHIWLPPSSQSQAGGAQGEGEGDGASEAQSAGGGSGGDQDKMNSNDPGRMGQIEDPKNKSGGRASEADKRKSEQDWKIAVAQAAKEAKNQGKLPGALERFIDAVLDPEVNWKDVLREFVEQVVKGDYSWMQPNRRHISQGFYLPILHSKCLGTIVITVDTSGSVCQRELERFASEISAILNEFNGLEADVYYVDTRIAGHEHFTPDDLPVRLNAKGGGGTDFRPVFKRIETEDEQPICLIYFSDMWCNSYPEVAPDYPVLWLNTSSDLHYGHPPFGQVLNIKA